MRSSTLWGRGLATYLSPFPSATSLSASLSHGNLRRCLSQPLYLMVISASSALLSLAGGKQWCVRLSELQHAQGVTHRSRSSSQIYSPFRRSRLHCVAFPAETMKTHRMATGTSPSQPHRSQSQSFNLVQC